MTRSSPLAISIVALSGLFAGASHFAWCVREGAK